MALEVRDVYRASNDAEQPDKTQTSQLNAIVTALRASVNTTIDDADIQAFSCLGIATARARSIDNDAYLSMLSQTRQRAFANGEDVGESTSSEIVEHAPRTVAAAKANDTSIEPQCANRLIHAAKAWQILDRELSNQDLKTSVAIVDSGARLNHPALAPHILGNDWRTDHDMVDDDHAPDDDVYVRDTLDCPSDTNSKRALVGYNYGHGTHIAGIVGAYIAGQTPRGVAGGYVDLDIYRVIDRNNDTNFWEVREGMCRAAKASSRVHNYSISTHELLALTFRNGQPTNPQRHQDWQNILELRKQIAAGNYLAVVAAGNEGRKLLPERRSWLTDIARQKDVEILKHFPAGFDDLANVISVAGTRTVANNGDCLAESDAPGPPAVSPGSNYHAVDIAAPGWEVTSTTVRTGAHSADYGRYVGICRQRSSGTPYTIPMVGTSFAAPFVSGAAALCFQACKEATPAGVKVALMCSADPYPANAKRNVRSGFLNAHTLVRRCADASYCNYLKTLPALGDGDLSRSLGKHCYLPDSVK